MRGKVHCGRNTWIRSGITPAHAGKRYGLCPKRPLWRDHPRPCGEKNGRRNFRRNTRGSPPPMRGKGAQLGYALAELGITPAHAGKSYMLPLLCPCPRDHPRPCGEKHMTPALKATAKGSPPPMRGKDPCNQHRQQRHRITPAHAGKSIASKACQLAFLDHPRPCGEKMPAQSKTRGALGSPPPMRGKVFFM